MTTIAIGVVQHTTLARHGAGVLSTNPCMQHNRKKRLATQKSLNTPQKSAKHQAQPSTSSGRATCSMPAPSGVFGPLPGTCPAQLHFSAIPAVDATRILHSQQRSRVHEPPAHSSPDQRPEGISCSHLASSAGVQAHLPKCNKRRNRPQITPCPKMATPRQKIGIGTTLAEIIMDRLWAPAAAVAPRTTERIALTTDLISPNSASPLFKQKPMQSQDRTSSCGKMPV